MKFLVPRLENRWQKVYLDSTKQEVLEANVPNVLPNAASDEGLNSYEPEKQRGIYTQCLKRKCIIKEEYLNLLLTMLLAVVCGTIGYFYRFPAGALVFSMVAVGTLNITTRKSYMPLILRRMAQALNGIIIGLRFQLAELALLNGAFVTIMFLTTGWLALNIILGILLHKWGKLPLKVSMLAASAGGMTDMGLIAEEMGANSTQVVVLQLSRVISVICLYPPIIKMITSLF